MSIKINNDTANGSSILQPSNTATGDVTHTLPAFTTELAPRMQLMTAQNSTSGTAIDFTGIPSWAKRITVMFSGVSTNGTSNYLVQLGSSGGVETTGYLGGGFNTALFALGDNLDTNGFAINSNVSSQVKHGMATFCFLSSNVIVGNGVFHDSTDTRTSIFGGSKTLSSTLDRIRITTVNGTDLFDGGQINILVEG